MEPYSLARRTLLRTTVAAGALSMAGCLGDDDEDDDDDDVLEPDDDDDPPADEDTEDDDGDDGDDEDDEPAPGAHEIETVVDGLSNPWALAVVPDEPALLVTERSGGLQRVDIEAGSMDSIGGIPDVFAEGQGGLLDVELHPDYPDEPWVYLTYAATDDTGASATHLGRGELSPGETEFADFAVLHVAEPFVDSRGHFGSRVVFGQDGMLYVTSGDRQFKDFGPDHVSQDTTNELGATLRLEPNGSIPDDNPFVDDDDVVDSIYTYGHRNAQGMTVNPETGELWQSEHGEEDGDEINVIEGGENYGWPIAHYGCEYNTDEPIGDLPHERDDVVDPVYYWECGTGGFPPAGMTFYDGDAFPEWQGDLFVGNLAGQYLGHFAVDGHDVEELDPLLEDLGWRIRDVAVQPETGYVYVVPDEPDAEIVRLVPP